MATDDTILVRNTLNGELARVRPAILNNPHLAKHLVEVEDGAKHMPLIKPTTSEEFKARRTTRKTETPSKEKDS